MKVALLITCLTENFFPRAGVAAVKVLEHLGCEVHFPRDQTCCGQPMFNSGHHAHARDLAERTVRIFAPWEHVVTPSASCAAMVREHYPALLADDPALRAAAESLAHRTHEFASFLTRVLNFDPRAHGLRWDGAATYHPACHLRALAREGAPDATPALLRSIDGLRYTPLDRADQCCGFGGLFAVTYPDLSGAMARDKADAVRATGANALVCNDAGCAMNITGACRRAGRGEAPRTLSLAEVLAEALGLMPEPRASVGDENGSEAPQP
mgnify:CR=1 FL=1